MCEGSMASLDADAVKALKGAIATDAPKLAALLDGPNASAVVSALGKSLLGDSEASAVDVTAAVQKGDKLKIAAAEQEAQLRLRQSGGVSLTDLTAADKGEGSPVTPGNEDTANGRHDQIETHDTTTKYLAYIVTGAFFVLITLLLFGKFIYVPAEGYPYPAKTGSATVGGTRRLR